MVPRPQHKWQWFIVLLVVAATLRIGLVMKPGLWADEIFTLAIATGHSLEHPPENARATLGDFVEPREAQEPEAFQRYLEHESPPAGVRRVIRAVMLSDTNPPLYYLLLNYWTRAAGTSDMALHLFSMIWALLCFPLFWLLGYQMGGKKTAWTACILFTFAPRALYYSVEGRMYSLVWFLGLSFACLTFKLGGGFRAPHIFLWIASGAAGLLTHYFFVFVWFACSVWLWIYPGKLRRSHLLASSAMTALDHSAGGIFNFRTVSAAGVSPEAGSPSPSHGRSFWRPRFYSPGASCRAAVPGAARGGWTRSRRGCMHASLWRSRGEDCGPYSRGDPHCFGSG